MHGNRRFVEMETPAATYYTINVFIQSTLELLVHESSLEGQLGVETRMVSFFRFFGWKMSKKSM